MTALDMILQWLILIVTGTLFINWAYRKWTISPTFVL